MLFNGRLGYSDRQIGRKTRKEEYNFLKALFVGNEQPGYIQIDLERRNQREKEIERERERERKRERGRK